MTAADKLRELLATRPAMPNTEQLVRWWRSDELVRQILEQVELRPEITRNTEYLERGFWRSCSGCHELYEGHPRGSYSKALKCFVGNGCHECGGLGAVWEQVPDEPELKCCPRFTWGDEHHDPSCTMTTGVGALKRLGISRVADNDQALLLSFSRAPTDQEMRDIDDLLDQMQTLIDDLAAREADLAGLTKYIDDAKRACGTERVSGEPLAQVITRMVAEVGELREAKQAFSGSTIQTIAIGVSPRFVALQVSSCVPGAMVAGFTHKDLAELCAHHLNAEPDTADELTWSSARYYQVPATANWWCVLDQGEQTRRFIVEAP